METFGILYIVAVLVALFAGVLWFFLPFAVFGTQPLIKQTIAEAKEANAHLKALVEQQRVLIEQQKVMLASSPRAAREVGA